jgi:phosphonate transport system substrate-binding protein
MSAVQPNTLVKWLAALAGPLSAALLLFATDAAADQSELLFGSVAMDIPAAMHKRLQPLTKYLSEGLGRSVKLKLSPNMDDAIHDISLGAVDLAYLTPVAYLKAHEEGGARLLVKTITGDEGSFQLVIVVKEHSPIKTVADLKGKVFAFGDKAAVLQRAVLVHAGVRLDELREYKFIGHYDNIVPAVINGDFDAGILKDTTAYKWRGKGLRILYASPALPPYNIAVSNKVSDELYKKLQALFLALNSGEARHREIMRSLDGNYSGFAPTNDREYDVIRELIKPFNSP